MRSILKPLPGVICIAAASAVLGFTYNSLNPHGLPLLRIPLRETRPMATRAQIESKAPLFVHEKKAVLANSARVTSVDTSAASKEPKQVPTENTVQLVASNRASMPRKTTSGDTRTAVSLSVAPTGVSKATISTPRSLRDAPQTKKAEALFTTLEDAKAYFDKKDAIFLDGRPEEDYKAEHIKGALSLYHEKLDELYGRVLGNVPKDELIITYCSDPECKTAIKLADGLAARGYTRVLILLEGLPGWKGAGYPTEKVAGG